ncbi:ABC transporter ATP-binding protein [Ferrimonas balearica]|uniref:ABC transporter ATP-binding protein n=1 Tax=Ferrimonas balearica TaxID=44012 RepID=UPI001F422820|nr:ABC transporter ATP-binding protein [Ferrimonas balearica]MBY6016355.1 ABC transporter ATP-binding protein [Halomonas denitrificans]MBY6095375.1 ABC transporter ATP-binding protein [Ferrimonas balearica]
MNDAAIHARDLRKSYRSHQALKGVSFDLEPGQMMALLGHNGAGKTTLMKLILGLIQPDTGTLSVLGGVPSDPRQRQQLAIGYLPEQVSLYPQLTGEELLTYFADLRGVSRSRVGELLAELDLAPFACRPVGQYSKGMRQRLGLAQALLGEPRLLLMDEPTVGLDPNSSAYLYHCLNQQVARGCAVVVCTHELTLIEPHFHHALIMAQGQVMASGDLATLRTAAGLKTRIALADPSDRIGRDDQLAPLWDEASQSLWVSPEHKARTIARLTGIHGLLDFTVTAPSLPDVYHHHQSRLGAAL